MRLGRVSTLATAALLAARAATAQTALSGDTIHITRATGPITVDGDRATASSLWMHVRRGDDDRPLLPTLGGYDDELIREDGRWRFLRRSVSPLVPAG